MRLTAPRLASLERTATLFRGLTLALAALAIALSGQPFEPRLVALGVAYAVWSGVLWMLAPHLGSAWVVYSVALADGAAVTGRVAAALAGSLSVLGYVSAAWLGTDPVPALALWPVAVLTAAAFAT